MATEVISFRVDAEYRARLKRTADKLGRSLSELFLRALNNDLAFIHKEMAKKANALVEILPEGLTASKEKLTSICRESLDDAEYFRDRLEALEKAEPVYREIENLESYRDFLRETVTEKA